MGGDVSDESAGSRGTILLPGQLIWVFQTAHAAPFGPAAHFAGKGRMRGCGRIRQGISDGSSSTSVRATTVLIADDHAIVAQGIASLLKDHGFEVAGTVPTVNHGYGSASNYMMRRRWDFFVKWLMDTDPPKEYQIK
jgi:hypothetical protein